MDVELSSLTSEPLLVKVTTTPETDPHGYAVETAFILGKTRKPNTGEWVTALWVQIGADWWISGVPSPTLTKLGTYYQWIRIHATPNLIVKQAPNPIVVGP